MTNKTKIVIGILIILAIIIGIIGIRQNIKDKETNTNVSNENNITNLFDDYIEENTSKNETENEIEENIISNEVNEETSKTENKTESNVVGKEEEESNQESEKIDYEQKAIELAKKKWAISVDSYNFQAEKQSEEIYKVTVRNKTDSYTVAIYTVNVTDKTVTE